MNVLNRSISQILRGAGKAFQTFPASIACAFAFAIVTIIRIHLDWPQQETYNFLFNCLHWSFAVGAIFSLAIIAGAQSFFNNKRMFVFANLIGAVASVIVFLFLYFLGESQEEISRYSIISGIAVARVSVLMLISILAFIVIAGYPKEESDFAKSSFMTLKAFFIALIYGLVIMGGGSGVAGAVQSLLYHAMSYKVYMYIGTFAGFMAFTIFLGYFPNFIKGQVDQHREIAQKQPRFIEVLFVYIMIPIVIALTVVLLIWSGRTVITGVWPTFVQLSSIATSYAIGGLWLHIMVTHNEAGIARFYRKFYPIAALVILAFEAWALYVQLGKTGLKIPEYVFSLLLIVTVLSCILLIIMKAKAHHKIVIITSTIALLAVLPIIGYYSLTISAQADRLEQLLISQGMFKEGKILSAATEPELTIRESITDAVEYLATARDAKLPDWFDKDLGNNEVFISKLGFEKVWAKPDDIFDNGPGGYLATSIFLPTEAIDINSYDWALNLQGDFQKGQEYVEIDGDNGVYRVYWITNKLDGIPTLQIVLNGDEIMNYDMNDFIDALSKKFPPVKGEPYEGTFMDMSVELTSTQADVLLVFSNIEINADPQADQINYWINLDAMYLNEKK